MAIWYTKVMPSLTPHYRVTAYDLRGHGYTDLTPSGYSSGDMARDLLGLMDHLGIERARLVGHSFGGSIGLHTALLRADRVDGVVLVDTGIACLRHLRTIKEWPGWKLYERELNDFGMTYEWFVGAESEDVNDVIRKSFEIPQQFGNRKGASRATPRLRRLVDETNLGREFRTVAGLTEERLAEITTPVLAVYGEQSPYQRMGVHLRDVLPNYRCDLVADTGHFYLLQSPELFVRRIEPFLADPLSYVRQASASSAPADSTPAERTT
jgi:pimeloyl-ACP methyl ester carboxylesterase